MMAWGRYHRGWGLPCSIVPRGRRQKAGKEPIAEVCFKAACSFLSSRNLPFQPQSHTISAKWMKLIQARC